MITPERALAFADAFDREHICIVQDGDTAPGFDAEITAMLRHYAEILPKYQALLDAEPVCEVVVEDYGPPFPALRIGVRFKECPPVGTQLIIKPKRG